ncbi:hypothetical protein M885DRAFT_172904 [Pelagophyceae sp. CCMP2097]|nr:hypothetical protein M885DRAFT_172904 [Pelagophyceae sp. CCMP2097]
MSLYGIPGASLYGVRLGIPRPSRQLRQHGHSVQKLKAQGRWVRRSVNNGRRRPSAVFCRFSVRVGHRPEGPCRGALEEGPCRGAVSRYPLRPEAAAGPTRPLRSPRKRPLSGPEKGGIPEGPPPRVLQRDRFEGRRPSSRGAAEKGPCTRAVSRTLSRSRRVFVSMGRPEGLSRVTLCRETASRNRPKDRP